MKKSNIQSFKQWTPKLGDRVMVNDQAFINGDVELGDDCSVWPMAVIRGDMHQIRIGNRVSIQDGILEIEYGQGWKAYLHDKVFPEFKNMVITLREKLANGDKGGEGTGKLGGKFKGKFEIE